METNIIKISHDKLKSILKYYWSNFVPSPSVGIVGEAGIGKTEVVQTTAKSLNYEYIYFNPVRKNPNTITGVPKVVDDYARWIPFKYFQFDASKKYVFHIDEITNAPPMVQASLLNIILEREAEDFKIPDNVNIVVSGNLSTHSRASFDFIEPLPSRLSLFELQPPNAEEWSIWASQNNIHPLIISFILSNPTFLLEKREGILYATPRGWARAGKVINQTLNFETVENIVSSFVGVRAGVAFRTFYQIKDSLPHSLRDAFYLIDTNFIKALKENNFSVVYYTISSLSNTEYIFDEKQIPIFFDALPPELQVLTMRLWCRVQERWKNFVKVRLWNWLKNFLQLKMRIEKEVLLDE